jgi:predicted transcriptional regulator
MDGGQRRRAPGELEEATLVALWTAGEPLSPAEVHAALGPTLAYNTVHTILTRLVDKGLVGRRVDGRRSVYAPVKDAAELAADRMRDVLAAAGDRERVLLRFVTSLNPDEEGALRAALKAAGRPTR